jgi:hypothetical protein
MARQEVGLMAFSACIIAISAFLSGAAVAVFIVLVIGIRKADRRCIFDAPGTATEAITRSVLGGGTRRRCKK